MPITWTCDYCLKESRRNNFVDCLFLLNQQRKETVGDLGQQRLCLGCFVYLRKLVKSHSRIKINKY